MSIATVTAPMRESQINNYLYVGEQGFANIQEAVDFARTQGGEWCVVIPHGYTDTDLISSITGGTTAINIHDERDARLQVYAWQVTYYRPEPFLQKLGFIATGEPPEIPASMVVGFDPQGTNGVGTGNNRVSANPGMGWPAWQVILEPQDGTAVFTALRIDYALQGGYPRIQCPSTMELYTLGARFNDHPELWIGQIPDAASFGIPGKGMSVWAHPDNDLIDIQGQTVSTGLYDQTIRLNYLGGDIQLGPNVSVNEAGELKAAGLEAYNLAVGNIYVDNSIQGTTGAALPIVGNVKITSGNLTVDGDLSADSATFEDVAASSASFTACEVDNSPVRTFANTPGGDGATFPPAGIGVSTGTAWSPDSIDPATVVVTDPTSDTIIDRGWHIFQIKGSAPPPVPGNGGSSGGSNPQAYVQLQGAMGQDTTGTTGQTAGNGGSALMGGGQGGAAPAGSTNGNGGPLYLSGGRSGQGAGAPGVGGDVLINNNWGNTYIGGNSSSNGCEIAFGGSIASAGSAHFNGSIDGAWLDVWGATGPAPIDPSGNGHVRIGQGGEGSTCIYMTRGGGTANQRIWGEVAWDNLIRFTCLSDDQSQNNVWMQCTRVGATPTQVSFGCGISIPPNAKFVLGSGGQQIWSDSNSLMLDGIQGKQIVLNYNNGNPGGSTTIYGSVVSEGPFEANSSIRSTGIFPTPQYPTNISHVSMGLINGNPTFPMFVQVNCVAPVDSKAYQNFVDNSGTMHYQLVNDADTIGQDWMKVDRVGTGNFTITLQGSTVCGYTLQVNSKFQVGAGGDFSVNVGSNISCWQPMICNSGLNVTQGGKNFRIVHPLDEEKYLFHSCIEGPEIAVFYRGEVVLKEGEAVVILPDYFEALTFEEERSILLTQVDDDKELAVMAASRIVKGKFRIRASVADATVAWEVKAVRRLGVDRLEVVSARDRASEVRMTIEEPTTKHDERRTDRVGARKAGKLRAKA